MLSKVVKEPQANGTLFIPKKGLKAREHWIAFGTKPKGNIIVDDGAKQALINKKSLLSVGIAACEGNFETGDIVACMAGFGDSIDVRMDGFHQKFSNDSLAKFFTAERAKYSSMKINMGDWESVISKDGKTEYVTMWYKQIWTDKAGKTDSLAVIDDCKMVNGKIAELDEKIQRYPAKK